MVNNYKGRAAVLAEVFLILAAIFWDLNYAAAKYVVDFVPPPLLVTLRLALSSLLLLGVCLTRRR